MKRMYSLVTFMAVALLVSGGLFGDEPKPTPAPTVIRVRKALPPNWNKLGLSDEQKQQIYGVQAEHQGKIDQLQKEIQGLKKKQLAAMEKVLTDAQKARLREIAIQKVPATILPKDDKKPEIKKDDKKPEIKPVPPEKKP